MINNFSEDESCDDEGSRHTPCAVRHDFDYDEELDDDDLYGEADPGDHLDAMMSFAAGGFICFVVMMIVFLAGLVVHEIYLWMVGG